MDMDMQGRRWDKKRAVRKCPKNREKSLDKIKKTLQKFTQRINRLVTRAFDEQKGASSLNVRVCSCCLKAPNDPQLTKRKEEKKWHGKDWFLFL